MRMRLLVCLFVIFALCPCSESATVAGSTADWCAVEDGLIAAGTSIVCGGVTSSALNRLNELLDSLQLTLAQELVQAERWARLYRDCIQRLQRMADHDAS